MYLYHGSPFRFEKPSIDASKGYKDFGKGFYLAEDFYDSLNLVRKNKGGYLYTFEINDEELEMLNIKTFKKDEEWARYVFENKTKEVKDDFDIVIGPTAGGKVSDIVKAARKNKTEYDNLHINFLDEISKTTLKNQWNIKNPDTLNKIKLVSIDDYTDDDFS